MPPDQTPPDDKEKLNSPQSPAQPTPAPKKTGDAEIDKILLPQKEVRVVQSTQRINAGVLLEQEITAGQSGFPKSPEELAGQKSSAAPRLSGQPVPPASAPKEESIVRPLETYQGDIERLVQDKNVSVVSIAAAEAGRRGAAATAEAEKAKAVAEAQAKAPRQKIGGKILMIIGGVLFLAAAAGAVGYLVLRPTSVPIAEAPESPFISVDDTKALIVAPADTQTTIMNSLESTKKAVRLSVGLVQRLVPAVSSTTAEGETLFPLNAQTFLSRLAPAIPPELLRTIEPDYLLGVHVFDGNQAFLILSVDSYEQGYSGLLTWEKTMQKELAPMFINTPSPQISPNPLASSTETFIKTSFFDKIIANHDARVVQNNVGDTLMFWTFLDRSTVVITTNESTLNEVIRRLEDAPITPTP